ncbi:MAG: hypothetical protein QXD89_02670 [Candidatus Aenigmatarchaeota archaeon]
MRKTFKEELKKIEKMDREEILKIIEDYLKEIRKRKEKLGELILEALYSNENLTPNFNSEYLSNLDLKINESIEELCLYLNKKIEEIFEKRGLYKTRSIFCKSPKTELNQNNWIVREIIEKNDIVKEIIYDNSNKEEIKRKIIQRLEELFSCEVEITENPRNGYLKLETRRKKFYDDTVYVSKNFIPTLLIEGEHSIYILHELIHRIFNSEFGEKIPNNISEEGYVTLQSVLFWDLNKLKKANLHELLGLYFSFSRYLRSYSKIKNDRLTTLYLISPAIIYYLRKNGRPYKIILNEEFPRCVKKAAEKLDNEKNTKKIFRYSNEVFNSFSFIKSYIKSYLNKTKIDYISHEYLKDYRGGSIEDFKKQLYPFLPYFLK